MRPKTIFPEIPDRCGQPKGCRQVFGISEEMTPAQEAKHLERRRELWKLRQSNGTNCSETPKRACPVITHTHNI